ncbi:MAG: high-potential iron-sulfur protein [Marinobacter sp.]|uniref:high-potential iron-sulfur protein n=1 Tax=Marinobacter sp. TaxID=50741 RepID=UPI0029C44D5A|nr:high-potential iron-sulfur protein [Marinobacter sp.]MDX5336579.1 high-potential iron-sulfur protein [Marinobacter sp.]MDX5387719.1 high-potential iron-sulfur protein [Marinobacter sp.]MDX5440305.1 high-potential iron-sulfur protein [Alteromonadaceae bacterium]MDX5473025.1 high-potential iron-sulfur protein [Marinobacter sp.]
MSDFNKSRRVFLRTAALGVAAVPLARVATHVPAARAEKPRAEDGHALDYVNDGSTSDHEKYQDGNKCSNCAFWAGEESGGWGGCRHPQFSDVLVNADGWCNTWVPGG